MWIVILSFFLDFEMINLNKIKKYTKNIKENTRITFLVVLAGIVIALLTKIFVVVPASILIGILLPGVFTKINQNKSLDIKMLQWIAFIDDLSSGVRAGLTLSDALAQALKNSEEPLRSEFLEAIVEFNRSGQVSRVLLILQSQIKDAVGAATVKLLSVVMKTGANDLASSLRILADASRETINLVQELKAKQSWVLNGARISVIAPWLVLLALWTQESVRVAYQNFTGQLVLVLVATVGVVGYFAMKRIGKIDVFKDFGTI
jgi:tight adherence protein B